MVLLEMQLLEGATRTRRFGSTTSARRHRLLMEWMSRLHTGTQLNNSLVFEIYAHNATTMAFATVVLHGLN